jgi:hypothetical protein
MDGTLRLDAHALNHLNTLHNTDAGSSICPTEFRADYNKQHSLLQPEIKGLDIMTTPVAQPEEVSIVQSGSCDVQWGIKSL